ncbi:MAG TPA: ABC transporter ATP-binding protein [Egibacteraceae bacterium]|nr:ABC transporter ATP-binding protein [Egibacteraceae bacterium]
MSDQGAAPGQQGGVCFHCPCVEVALPTDEGPRTILAGLGFDIHVGEFVSLVGRSGTGKTTLLRVLGGLLAPDPGSTVLFDGVPVKGPPEGVVMVFQNYGSSLLPWRTLEKNVALGIEDDLGKEEQRERVRWALQMVGLADRAQDYPWRLSGGMQQRLQIARALAMRPSVLLMDEPFGALDAMTRGELEDELLAVHEATGTTVVFVTHDIDEAVYLSDRVLVIQGSPATLGAEIPVECDRPRHQIKTKESEGFLKARQAVYEAIGVA